jgi:rRNA maturation endonuclease Nob1
MCGSYSYTAPAPKLPNRHQIRHAVRKVARIMRKDKSVRSLSLADFVNHVLIKGDWARLSGSDQSKVWLAVEKLVKSSVLFKTDHSTGFCGGSITTVKVRKSAKL